MWNGPDGKVFFVEWPQTDGAVICPAFRSGPMPGGHDEIRNTGSPNQFCALESAASQTV
jgi:hypothetical protein